MATQKDTGVSAPADENNTGSPAPKLADKTFTTYDTNQSSSYQTHRPAYPSALIEYVLNHHTDTTPRPSDGILLDVGCGPGTATRSLSTFFQTAHACDPSASMIETARTIPSSTASGGSATYHVCPAETLTSLPVQKGSVDLITAAMAAHWFDLPKFYAGAAKLLKPSGTLAIWTASSYYSHPQTTPNNKVVQSILFDLERHVLAPYEAPGNRLSRDMYDDLPLPWTVDPKVPDFPPPPATHHNNVNNNVNNKVNNNNNDDNNNVNSSTFVRREWNRDGALTPSTQDFLRGHSRETLDELGRGLGTASMVTRWREANRARLDAGEVEDCVDVTVRKLRDAMGGRDWIDAGSGTVVLLFKKRA